MEFVGILQSARFGFEVNTEYSLMLYCCDMAVSGKAER